MNVRMVPVSGSGFRPSLFGGSVQQSQTFHPSLSGGSWMGATTNAEWYARAKASAAQFDALLDRTGIHARARLKRLRALLAHPRHQSREPLFNDVVIIVAPCVPRDRGFA